MATARALPTAPHLPRHYYTTLGPRRRSIVVAREAEGGGVGPCGRHVGGGVGLAVLRSPCRITYRSARSTRNCQFFILLVPRSSKFVKVLRPYIVDTSLSCCYNNLNTYTRMQPVHIIKHPLH